MVNILDDFLERNEPILFCLWFEQNLPEKIWVRRLRQLTGPPLAAQTVKLCGAVIRHRDCGPLRFPTSQHLLVVLVVPRLRLVRPTIGFRQIMFYTSFVAATVQKNEF